MAAIVPTAIKRSNWGSDNVVIATFSTVADGDTWASGIASIGGKWTDDNSNPATQTLVGVASTFDAGTFTFYPAEDGTPFTLFAIIE